MAGEQAVTDGTAVSGARLETTLQFEKNLAETLRGTEPCGTLPVDVTGEDTAHRASVHLDNCLGTLMDAIQSNKTAMTIGGASLIVSMG
jgi:hypothetical protein